MSIKGNTADRFAPADFFCLRLWNRLSSAVRCRAFKKILVPVYPEGRRVFPGRWCIRAVCSGHESPAARRKNQYP